MAEDTQLTDSQKIRIKALRLAYRAAKTDEARKAIVLKAELIKNPMPPDESAELEKNVKDSLLTLPDWGHPYWHSQRRRK